MVTYLNKDNEDMSFFEIRLGESFFDEQTFYPGNASGSILPYTVRCDPTENRNFFEDPYIKVGDGKSWGASRRSVRVHLVDMGLNYTHNDGKDDFILNSKDKKILNTIMQTSIEFEDEIMTVENAIRKYLEGYDKKSAVLTPFGDIDFKLCYIRK